MKIERIIRVEKIGANPKLLKAYNAIEQLIEALNKKEVSKNVLESINSKVKEINAFTGDHKSLTKLIKKTDKDIQDLVETEFGWVKKSYYQSLWMVYGMLAGAVFSTVFTQLGFVETWSSYGLAIPMGLIFGMLAGKNKDTQAKKDGLQLDL